MSITLISDIKQKNDGQFFLVDSDDIDVSAGTGDTSAFPTTSLTNFIKNIESGDTVAGSAEKLDVDNTGDSNTPVYFKDGIPVVCTSLDLNTSGSAAKLATAGTVQVDLASDSAATYTNGGDITPGVKGILDAPNGGTGNATGRVQIGQKSGETLGTNATSEGNNTQATGNWSHAEGSATVASGASSHAEGTQTTASGSPSHAEGYLTVASESYAHAEGQTTTASGNSSHAEGYSTVASGAQSHAEGYNTEASGITAHSEGRDTVASGDYSHASGYGTKAEGNYSTVIGHYNDSSEDLTNYPAFTIGNGTADNARSNAYQIDFNGNSIQSGKISAEEASINGNIIAKTITIEDITGVGNDGNGNLNSMDLIGNVNVTGNLFFNGAVASGVKTPVIELNTGGATQTGTGGYIDFHWHENLDTDYTSRIIENSPGNINIQALNDAGDTTKNATLSINSIPVPVMLSETHTLTVANSDSQAGTMWTGRTSSCKASDKLIVTVAPGSSMYEGCTKMVHGYAHADGTITFKAYTAIATDVVMNVLILRGG